MDAQDKVAEVVVMVVAVRFPGASQVVPQVVRQLELFTRFTMTAVGCGPKPFGSG